MKHLTVNGMLLNTESIMCLLFQSGLNLLRYESADIMNVNQLSITKSF